MYTRIFVVAALSTALLSGCGGGSNNTPGNTNPAQPTPTNSVSGTVSYKGVGLQGATVVAIMTNTSTIYQTTTTDASGNYSFTGISATGNVPGNYLFFVTKAGYGFYPSVGSGATITRADQTTMFSKGNNVNAIELALTVINFTSLPGGSLSGANFIGYDAGNAQVNLGVTGQTKSYTAGDDGSLKKGVPWSGSRFTDNQDGTVTDSLTGLVWLKNAGCFATAIWATALTDANQLASGSCGLTDSSKAGDWRLPNLSELESIVDVSGSSPALTPGNPFTNVSQSLYWTSTSYYEGQAGSSEAWTIRMSDGRYVNDRINNLKATSNNAVWAVKGKGPGAVKLQATGMMVPFAAGDDGTLRMGVPLTFPRFVDNGNGTVTDTVTGLIWLKQANCINQPWAGAVAAVNALASGQCGLTDGSTAGSWRMPNRKEMQSLSDRMENNHSDFFNSTYTYPDGHLFLAPTFSNFVISQYYWTSSTDAFDTTEAWTVYSCDFGVYDTPKGVSGYTLAVR